MASVFVSVAVTLTAVAGRPGTFLGMAAQTEFVGLLFVKAELARWPFMAFGTRVEAHMLRVVEINIPIICLEYLCLSMRAKKSQEKQCGNIVFHGHYSVRFLFAALYDSV